MQDIKDLADNGIYYRPQLVPDFFHQHLPSKRLETTRPSTKFVHVFSNWPFYPLKQGTFEDDVPFPPVGSWRVHLGRLTWNLQITRLERKKIFQTSVIMVHVNFPGCITDDHSKKVTFFPWENPSLWCPGLSKLWAGVALSAGDWVRFGPYRVGLGLTHEIVLGCGWNFARLKISSIWHGAESPKVSRTISRLRWLFLFLQYISRLGTSSSNSIGSFWQQEISTYSGTGESKRVHFGF